MSLSSHVPSEYADRLDENGECIRPPSADWKSHKEDTVDRNDQENLADLL
ncbi:MAG TPA: hypothetical protein H9880_02385 [Candidatus Anaerobutyricum avicola]|nr:hypothetical protein [Candidatus Anaerobutyricum avicola]